MDNNSTITWSNLKFYAQNAKCALEDEETARGKLAVNPWGGGSQISTATRYRYTTIT